MRRFPQLMAGLPFPFGSLFVPIGRGIPRHPPGRRGRRPRLPAADRLRTARRLLHPRLRRPARLLPEERTVLTALAGLIAQSLRRAQRYDTESALVRGLQNALLSHRLPVLEYVDTAGRYLAGTQGMDVGGDWYDVIETERGLALVIGDVQGHGVAAAATMGQLRSAVRAFALSGHDPQEVVSGTNRLLIDLDPGQIASCCYVVLDPVTGRTQAVRAGHPQPLLRHPDHTTEVLDLPGGIVLGVAPVRPTRSATSFWTPARSWRCTPTDWSSTQGPTSIWASSGCAPRSSEPTCRRSPTWRIW